MAKARCHHAHLQSKINVQCGKDVTHETTYKLIIDEIKCGDCGEIFLVTEPPIFAITRNKQSFACLIEPSVKALRKEVPDEPQKVEGTAQSDEGSGGGTIPPEGSEPGV